MNTILIIIFFIFLSSVQANEEDSNWEREYNKDTNLIVENVRKRNKPGCDRLGNVYGYCEWIVVMQVRNNFRKPMKQFCSNLKVNQKKFDFCYGKKNKIFLKDKDEKKVLLNLGKLIKFPNDYEKPTIKISNIRFIF